MMIINTRSQRDLDTLLRYNGFGVESRSADKIEGFARKEVDLHDDYG